MAMTIGGSGSMHVGSGNALEIKTAKLAKDQMELEGKMAVELIQSAAVPQVNSSTTTSGNHINIKA